MVLKLVQKHLHIVFSAVFVLICDVWGLIKLPILVEVMSVMSVAEGSNPTDHSISDLLRSSQ